MLTKATAGLEYKFTKFTPTDIDPRTGSFVGLASKFGNEDLGGDIVAKGAFADTLKQRDPRRCKMLYEHDHLQPVGVWEDLRETSDGLLATGKLLLPDQNGRGGLRKAEEVYTLMREGVIDGLSIGYRVEKATQDRSNPSIRILEKVDLREISVVLFPMNEEAVIQSVKSDLPIDSDFVREFERLLMQDAGLTRSKARQIIGGYKSLISAKQDAGGDEVATSMQPAADWMSPIVEQLRQLAETIR